MNTPSLPIGTVCLMAAASLVSAGGYVIEVGHQRDNRIEPSLSPRIELPLYVVAAERKGNGIGMAVAYDSRRIRFNDYGYLFPQGLIGKAEEADAKDVDGNPATDRLVRLAWMSLQGVWPGAAAGDTHLATLVFDRPPSGVPQFAGSAPVANIVSLSSAGGHGFATVPVVIEGE